MHTAYILFLCPYPPNEAPSQRFRFEQYFSILQQQNIAFKIAPFIGANAWKNWYKDGKSILKAYYIVKGILKRIVLSFTLKKYHFVFIHREAAPFGPPVLEWIIAKVAGKKIIYDFDDAIWLEDPNEKGTLLALLKWKSKVAAICRWSHKVSVGNRYLYDFARQFNRKVTINPTTIDTEQHHNPAHFKSEEKERLVLGWTGTHSTLQYLKQVIPAIQELEKKYDFDFLVIANKNPEFMLRSFKFIPWKKDTEVADLMQIDIGLMPLSDDEWSEGKCGFKLLQYMALEKPVVASPVGVNTNIVDEGTNGFLCESQEEWIQNLSLLTTDVGLREQLGKHGRQKVVDNYSVTSNTSNFLSLFE